MLSLFESWSKPKVGNLLPSQAALKRVYSVFYVWNLPDSIFEACPGENHKLGIRRTLPVKHIENRFPIMGKKMLREGYLVVFSYVRDILRLNQT